MFGLPLLSSASLFVGVQGDDVKSINSLMGERILTVDGVEGERKSIVSCVIADDAAANNGVLGIVPTDVIVGVIGMVPVECVIGVIGIVPVDFIIGVLGMVPVETMILVGVRKSIIEGSSCSVILLIKP